MSDARALLRQQRTARRINHPHASYTDSGKLTCTVCREPLRSDALWDAHARSAGHRQRLLAQQKSRQQQQQQQPAHTAGPNGSGPEKSKSASTDTLSDEALLAQIIGGGGAEAPEGAAAGAGQKRKLGDVDSDVDMEDSGQEDEEGDSIRKKRSRQDITSPTAPSSAAMPTSDTNTASNGRKHPPADPDAGKGTPPSSSTPPGLSRRTSGTPSHGIELQIPSRPATPNANGASGGSTPRAAGPPIGRSPLIPQEGSVPPTTSAPRASFATPAVQHAGTAAAASAATATAAADGDEDEDWAAFEAEVVNAPPPTTTTTTAAATNTTAGGTAAADYSDAVIAAAPLTAEQVAARTREEEREGRRARAEAELEDDREDATRALENEFEEMEELEARVRRLKEKREAIRRGGGADAAVPAAAVPAVVEGGDLSIGADAGGAGQVAEEDDDEDDDDDDEDEEEDDWAGFRFKA